MQLPHNSQNSSHSTTVWTQPATDEQRRYYSKHAGERRVFGWITSLLQTAHGAIAFAAWTAIYLWIFKAVPFMVPTAPFIAGATLIALHILFRTTWQTFWYDKLDNDPNTDSPIWVPVAIFILLITLEVQGAKQYLAGQVAPVAEKNTTQIDAEHATTIASIEQAYRNQVASINEVYKAKTAPIDRQIASARNRSADTDQERRQNRNRIAALQSQRDAILAEKATELKRALDEATGSRTKATARREQAVTGIDTHNAGELARYSAEMGSVGTYAWVLSLGLLFLIAGLSYRTVRINVKSGIIPLRNYTVLDAHGSLPERIFTAIADAVNRRGLQFAVWMHRMLSPKSAITSFDGTVVAQPGTYNTPEGFHPTPTDDEALRRKVADKVLREAARGELRITPEMLEQEFQNARRLNGRYKDTPIGGKPEPSPAPQSAHPAEGPTIVPPSQRGATQEEYDELVKYWAGHVHAQLAAYDNHVRAGEPAKARAIQEHVFNDDTSYIRKEAKRLGLVFDVQDGEFVVRRRDRSHWVPLAHVSERSLEAPAPADTTPQAGEDEDLFKCDLNRFKQDVLAERDPVTGKVIGVKYKKADGGWGNIGLAQVKAFHKIYARYNEGKENPGSRVRENLAKWQYALSLFEEGREVVEDNLQTVTQ